MLKRGGDRRAVAPARRRFWCDQRSRDCWPEEVEGGGEFCLHCSERLAKLLRNVVTFWAVSRSLICGGLLTAGCLSPPPEYETPTQIPPFIIRAGVTPHLDQFHVVEPRQTLALGVPFRSEDLEEAVEAQVLLDSEPGFPPVFDIDNVIISPSTLDQVRTVDLPVAVPRQFTGCHTLTMVLTHESNTQGSGVRDIERAAWVTWWLDIRENRDDPPSSIENCPVAGFIDPPAQ
jgi:hypothetical protein